MMWFLGCAWAYKFSSPPVHEALTLWSVACKDHPDGERACAVDILESSSLKERWKADRKALQRDCGEDCRLPKVVRWPDLPSRSGLETLVWMRACGSGEEFRGLLCESHFGRMQFMHAQVSSSDEHADAENLAAMPSSTVHPPSTALRDTWAWMEFCFLVATGKVGPDEALADHAPFAGEADVWGTKTVADLFQSYCPAPTAEPDGCERIVGEKKMFGGGAADLRTVALGSMLHTLQDSFSMTHVQRTPELDEHARPLIVCGPIHRHFRYKDGKLQKKHAKADKWPRVDSSCLDEPAIDPITAGALLLESVDTGDLDAFRKLTRQRLLPQPGSSSAP